MKSRPGGGLLAALMNREADKHWKLRRDYLRVRHCDSVCLTFACRLMKPSDATRASFRVSWLGILWRSVSDPPHSISRLLVPSLTGVPLIKRRTVWFSTYLRKSAVSGKGIVPSPGSLATVFQVPTGCGEPGWK